MIDKTEYESQCQLNMTLTHTPSAISMNISVIIVQIFLLVSHQVALMPGHALPPLHSALEEWLEGDNNNLFPCGV